MPQQEEKKQQKLPPTSAELYEMLIKSSEAEKVETLASLFFTTKQIAAFIGKPIDDFVRVLNHKPNDPLTLAYHRGKMKTEIILRFDTNRFALAGSPEALKDMKEYLLKQNISEHEE